MKHYRTKTFGVFTGSESPIKSLYVTPELRTFALLNENSLCAISSTYSLYGDNEDLTEDEMGNDYDE